MNIFYYDVAVDIPVRQCFTYKSISKIKKGTRVTVPFGKKTLIGIVIKVSSISTSIVKTSAIKEIISVDDQYICFKKPLFNTLLWASEYYHHPIGEVFLSFLPSILRKQTNKSIINIDETSNYKINSGDKNFDLTSEQEIALKKLKKIEEFNPTLIYGVTGSGKTEIYLRLVEKLVQEKKSVLILVPEINLVPQMLDRFKKRFDGEIGAYHSKLTPNQRLKIWLKSRLGGLKIVIGTRSAVMMPLKNIGAIIIDEEHDQSYKQSEGFKFSGRDLAIKRAQLENIPIYLGSATPSLQTLKLVKEKKFKQVNLLNRIDGKKPPKLIPLDISNSPLIGGIAMQTMGIIQSTIAKGEQALIFINRRGFAPLYECDACGWVAKCNSCESNLVFHKSKNRLICHKCESIYGVNDECPDCYSKEINLQGYGTERVEEVLENAFKKIPIIRFDYDSTRLKGAIESIYEKVHSNDAAILVGTQMLSKGHDFPKVTLCVILNADSGLISPEINALEKISQQLIQVSGRAGRNNNLAKVIIQTRYPDDINLKQIKTGNYQKFADQCLQNNKNLDLPPYSHVCILRTSSPKSKGSIDLLQKVSLFLAKKKGISLIGPLPSIPSMIKGNVRHHVIIKASSRSYLNRVLKSLIKDLENWPEIKKAKWSFDIDPYDMS